MENAQDLEAPDGVNLSSRVQSTQANEERTQHESLR